MTVNILGTDYEIIKGTEKEYSQLIGSDGYCSYFDKKIYINDLIMDGWEDESLKTVEERTNHIMRHEIIHAFLYESGLYSECKIDSSWALNEEMIDWMAIQMPKIMKAYESTIVPYKKTVEMRFFDKEEPIAYEIGGKGNEH